MKERKTKAFGGLLFGLTCALGCASFVAFAAPTPKPPYADSLDNPAPAAKGKNKHSQRARSIFGSGDEGGIAGPTVTIWDNGPIDSGTAMVCTVPGTRSTLQNTTPICLTTLGFGLTGGLRVADDFTITECADIQRMRIFAYLTAAGGSAAATITAASVSLHSGKPWSTTSNLLGTSTMIAEPPAVTTIYRATTTNCDRRMQTVVLDTSAWPTLPPGTYWVSWNVTGASFCPPVTVLGQQAATGGNAMQGAPHFANLVDAGVAGCTPPPTGVVQAMPFILEGTLGCPPCLGDANASGTVDVDDLVIVILTWGCTVPPGPCGGDVNGNGVVNVDDLVIVILNWGACQGPPAPPVSTGACCVGTACSSVTFQACAAAGGTYFGDGVDCSATSGCLPPGNDDCPAATAIALGTTTFNTTLATNSPEAIACAAQAFQLSRDVWFTFPTTAGTAYTVTTTATPAGPASVGDTGIVVYSGACGTLTLVACNDDVTPPPVPATTLSTLTFTGDGTVHRIRIGTFVAAQATIAQGGNIVLDITTP